MLVYICFDYCEQHTAFQMVSCNVFMMCFVTFVQLFQEAVDSIKSSGTKKVWFCCEW